MTLLTSNAPLYNPKNPPPPLVLPSKKPLTWLKHKGILLPAVVVFTWVGTMIVAGLYYLVFQTIPTVNTFWHDTVPNTDLRHAIRDVGEGLLGGLLAQQVIWNHYHKRMTKPLTRLDRLEIKLHIANIKDDKTLSVWQLIATPWLAVIYAIPGFIVGFGIAWFFKHDILHSQSIVTWLNHSVDHQMTTYTGGLWSNAKASLADNWDKKLIGFGAAFFFGRRPARGVFDDLQLYFVQHLVSNNLALKKWHTPNFRARYNDVKREGYLFEKMNENTVLSKIVVATIVVSVILFATGVFVIFFIAP